MKISGKWFNKKLFFGFLILVALLALIDWILFGRTPMHEIKSVTQAVGNKITGRASGFAGAAQAAAVSAAVAVSSAPTIDPAKASVEEFKQWFDSEVILMNQYNVNEEQMQQRYLQLTSKMNPEQFRLLSIVARAQSSKVNDRVLAAYLLGFAGYANVGDLAVLALSPIKLQGKPEAHSMAETQQVQERALRVLAINRLADLARGDNPSEASKAKERLVAISKSVTDPTLKNYAENKLKEISK